MDIHNRKNSKTVFCATCLSQNREMFAVKDMSDLLLLCPDIMLSKRDKICWECKAVLQKMQLFKFKARQAQKLLKKIIEEKQVYDTSLRSLSHLTIHNNDSFVIEIQSSQVTNDNHQEIHPSTKVKLEKYEKDSDTNDYSDNVEMNIDTFKIKTESNSSSNGDIKEEKVAVKQNENVSMLIPYKMRTISEQELSEKRQKKLKNKLFQKKWYKCVSCVFSFPDENLFEDHVSKSHCESSGQFICDICNQRFRFKSDMEEHIKEHYICYICPACNSEYLHKDDLFHHCEMKHEIIPRKCETCDQEFRTWYKYSVHLRKHKERPICDHCGRSFTSKSHLVLHMDTHKVYTKPIECKICHKRCQSKRGLKVHVNVHEKPVDVSTYCVKCNKEFKHPYSYRLHLKTSRKHVKESDMKFKCSHCVRAYPLKAYLERHIAFHHTDRRNHICQICNKGFPVKEKLVLHTKRKHEGIKKPKNHMCDICSKTFYNKETLKEHINSHIGRRPYVCEYCGATFSYYGARYTHIKLKHKIEKEQKLMKMTA